jgi:hypothetical protein
MSPRQSRTTTGSLILLTSKTTVDLLTSDAPPPIQDGGNSSDTKEHLLSMRKERYSMSVEMLMLRTGTSKFKTRTMDSTNNGTLSTLTNGRENQERESSMRNSV